MQFFPQPRDLIEKIALFVQGLQLWALELAALWVELFGGRRGRIDLRRRLRDLRRHTRLVFMIAVAARMRVLRGAPATTRPRSFRRGACYQLRRTRWLRMVTRGIRLDTLEDIRAALDSFDALVARAFARLPKRFLAGALVMCGSVDDAVPAFTADARIGAPDTS